VIDPGSEQYATEYDTLMNDFMAILAPRAVPIVVLDNPVTRPDDGVLGDEPEAHLAWRTQIERWDNLWEPVARINIDDALADPNSAQGRQQRPDGVHLEEIFAADLARTRIVPELTMLYSQLIDHLDDIGCRVTVDGETAFDIASCRSAN
jgi:hypothetical protein